MPIKKDNLGSSDPLPYCNISRPMRNYSMCFDNCFSPQAKNHHQIYSPNKPTNSNPSYPYYMPEEWFAVAPPMAIEIVEEEEEEEEEEEIRKISQLPISMKLAPENLMKEVKRAAAATKRRGLNGGYCSIRGGHGRPVEELTHRLERFKIKTLNLGGAVVKKATEEH